MQLRILVDGEPHEIEIEGAPPLLTIRVDGASYRTRVSNAHEGYDVRIGSGLHRVLVRGTDVVVDGQPHAVTAEPLDTASEALTRRGRFGAGTVLEVRPPMPGRVVKVRAAAGDHVKRGQTLVVLEAMKMQNEIPAPEDAVVRSVSVHEGESIPGDRVIAVLEAR
ncbi:MAG TPA: biotin/lipoyl-containing protein [Thermoplasmata archaeon]|nr:biotin/lipoyl-containing protein [Thermoplasmata archaeon]